MINIVIADDHPIFLEGISSVIQSRYRDIHIVGMGGDGYEAVDAYVRHRPDVVLLDIRMPRKNGIEAAKEIRAIDPKAKIMILTTFDEQHLIEELFAYGINGYVLKETPLDEVVMDIRLVNSGQTAMNNLIMQKLYKGHGSEEETRCQSGETGGLNSNQLRKHPQLKELGVREIQIFMMMLNGKQNPEIACELNLSEGTVRNYVHTIYNALDVHKRSAVIIWAIEQGIL